MSSVELTFENNSSHSNFSENFLRIFLKSVYLWRWQHQFGLHVPSVRVTFVQVLTLAAWFRGFVLRLHSASPYPSGRKQTHFTPTRACAHARVEAANGIFNCAASNAATSASATADAFDVKSLKTDM